MAGPPNQEELQRALKVAQQSQKAMERGSQEVLLDEDIALKDLSHQRSPVDTRPQTIQFPSTGATGWRRGHDLKSELTETGRTGTLTMGRIYRRMGKLSIIPRYLIYILPLAILIAIPIIIGALVPSAELGGVRIVWIFMWVEIVWSSLWASKIFAKLLPWLFKELVGFVSAGTAKYHTIIKALEVPNTLVAWSFVSFITFIPIMTRNPTNRAEGNTAVQGWESTLRQILAAILVSACVYWIQKTFIQFVAVNFHKVSYEERIQKNKAAVHILARLYEQSAALFPTFTHDFRYDDDVISRGDSGISAAQSVKPGRHHMHTGSGTVTPTMRAVKKAVNKATSAIGSATQEITGKNILQPTSPYNTVVEALGKTDNSMSLARRIWFSFCVEGEQSLRLSDFEEVLGNPEEAKEAMNLFDKDLNGDVTLEEAEMVVSEISKERKSLARSMRDVDSAIQKLDGVLVVVVFIIAIFTFIAFLNTDFATTLATAGTALLSLSFIFSVTCQEILASILFLFYKHPFDVGDRVNISGDKYVVKELSLLFTIFRRTDGTIVQVNNAILNSAWIENIRRSTTISESIQLQVDFGTSFALIQKLRQEMTKFVQANTRDYASDLEVEIMDAKGLDKLTLQLIIKHKSNWQNDALRAHRRNKFMCALVQAIRKIGIVASGPGCGDAKNPMHIVRLDSTAHSTATTPGSEWPSSSNSDFDSSFGQKQRVGLDPVTQVDEDDRTQAQMPSRFYGDLDARQQRMVRIGDTEREAEGLRPAGTGVGAEGVEVERGPSFGRRRKQTSNDLEKGESS